jgi:hypothetical protein
LLLAGCACIHHVNNILIVISSDAGSCSKFYQHSLFGSTMIAGIMSRATRSAVQKAAVVAGIRSSSSTRVVFRGNSLLLFATTSFSTDHAMRFQSYVAVQEEYNFDSFQPMGDLFESKLKSGSTGQNLVGKRASIRRVFGPSANAQGLLTCGGEELARHASFDPDYDTARKWIQSRAIGPAVLSPVLISGLVGALVEAALPQTVPLSSSMNHLRPLIVGVEVCARIEVDSVKEANRQGIEGTENVDNGYEICLTTEVVRVQDDAVISEGKHKVWMPGYLTM